MVRALTGVSFRVEAGQTLTVLGKFGSGKTTLLYCLGGLEQPDQGRVTCWGEAMQALSPRALGRFQRQKLGFVFQQGNLLSYLTVAQNLDFPLVLNGMAEKDRNRRVAALLDRIGLPQAGAALPHELSGGELQRVAVARALAHSPRLLLADEPTASLDSLTALNLVRLMTDLGKKQGCTLIIATHDADLMALADAHLWLRDGQVVKPEELA